MSTSTSMPSSGSLRRSPYQGLIPYGEDDAPYFFGREKEARLIAANLFASPLTLLYGASGVGKSSVLRAGVAHQLRRRDDLLVVVFNSWQRNPVGDLMQAVAAAADLAGNNGGERPVRLLTQDPRASLVEFLATCAERLNRRLMIILDQFEEYFLYHAQNEEFATEFPKAVRQSDAPVSFLISIREDFYAKLDRFEGTVPALYDNYLRLEHLDREAAQVAIEKPIEQYNRRYAKAARPFSIEPELVEAVLRQVETGQVILGESGRGVVEATKSHEDAEARIETPFLQLVMTRLWDEEVGERSHNLRLQTLSHLGGAENIVRSHLDAVMSALLPREQEIAASIFHYLVTPSGTKIAYSASDLAGSAELDEPEVMRVLEELAHGDIRIIRPVDAPVDRPTALRYEIFHDVLAPAILAWRTGYVQTQERAEAQRCADEQRRQAEEKALAQGTVAGRLRRLSVALALVILMALGFAGYAMTLRAKAVANAEKANTAKNDAVEAAAEADRQKARAEEQGQFADEQRKRADDQKIIAEGKATEAENAKAEGDAQRVIAVAESARADQQTIVATSRELATAAAANLRVDPELSVLLGIEALSKLSGHPVRETDEKEAKSALHEALQTSRIRLTLPFEQSKGTDLAGPTGLRISSNGRVVMVGRNVMATVWDAVTGKQSLVLSGVFDSVEHTALSPDGSLFAAAGRDPRTVATTGSAGRTRVVLWYTATGQSVDVPSDSHLGILRHLFFINDGKTLVLEGYVRHPDDRTSVTLQLWDIAARRLREFYDLNTGPGATDQVVLSSDGKRILTVGSTQGSSVWDAPFERASRTLPIQENAALSPDGKLVAGLFFGRNYELRLWEVDSGKEFRTYSSQETGSPGFFANPAFSPDGKNLAASDTHSGVITVWDVNTGRVVITTPGYAREDESLDLSEETRQTHIPIFSFSADGRLFAAYGGGGTVKVWSAVTGKEFLTVAGRKSFVRSIAFSPDGQRLITGSDDGLARVWDVSRSHEVFTISRVGDSRLGEVDNIAYSPDGKHLAGCRMEGGIAVWDAQTGDELYCRLSSDAVVGVAYSPNGKRLAVSDRNGKVTMLHAASGDTIYTSHPSSSTIWGVAFSPDGSRLAAACLDGNAYVLDADSGRRTHTLSHEEKQVLSVAFSPDGRYLATGSADHTAKVWDLARDYKELHTLKGHNECVWRVVFSPDGKRIATASHDSFVKIWDVATGLQLLELSGHRDKVWGVAFSPDGRHIATTSSDLTTKVWDANSGEELLTLSGHTKTINQAAFSPVASRLATCSDDGTIRVYTLDSKELVTLARKRISPGRTLTPDERKRYLHEVVK